MTSSLTRRKPFLLALLLVAASICSQAGEGHDHGDAPMAAAGPAKPRFSATSETFELVGVVNGTHITLYLDHAADNSPVKDAAVELTLGATKLAVQPHGEGEFEATLGAELQPGDFSVTASVVAGPVAELLTGDLDIHADTHADAAHGASWTTYGAWAAGGLLIVTLLALAMRRMGAQRNARVGGAA